MIPKDSLSSFRKIRQVAKLLLHAFIEVRFTCIRYVAFNQWEGICVGLVSSFCKKNF